MTKTDVAGFAAAPAHVPAERVFDFDIFDDDRMRSDPHRGFLALQRETPDLFYSRANGGHWVVTRHALLNEVMVNSDDWSSIQTQVPLLPEPHVMIPLHLDPPANTPYRAMIMRHFTKPALAEREATIRKLTISLVEAVKDRGGCDFCATIAAPFPITVFMQMMGLPLERFEEFRGLALAFIADLHDIDKTLGNIAAIQALLEGIIAQRRAQPTGDIISTLAEGMVDGQRVTPEALKSMCFLLFIAGLDTVANAAGFLFLHLAQRPNLQALLRERPDRIDDYVDEVFRRYGIVTSVRTARRDLAMDGVAIRKGDPLLAPLPLAGLDERVNPDPERFDIDRPSRTHIFFGGGAHLCVGHILARLELRILIEEWLKRIPSFGLKPGRRTEYRLGQIMSLVSLDLDWSAA